MGIGSEKFCLVLGINFVPLQARESRLVRFDRKFKTWTNLTNRDFLAHFVQKLCVYKHFVSLFLFCHRCSAKTQKFKKFAIGRLRLVGPVGQRVAIMIFNSFHVVLSPILASKPNLIKIGSKTHRSWISQEIAIAISKIFFVVLCRMLPPITNFTQKGWKIQKFKFSKFLKHRKISKIHQT